MIPEFLEKMKNPFPAILGAPKRNDPKSIPGLTRRNEKTDWIESEFNAALAFEQKTREQESESWKLFSGLDNGQWDKEAVAKLKEEQRNPFQGNFIRSKVTGLAGAIIKNFFDIDYDVLEDGQIELARTVKKMLYSDKELMDWNYSYQQLVMAGLIHRGVEELVVSTKYTPLGNLGFKFLMPGHIILDPLWLSNDSSDLRRAWKIAYLTADRIKQIYQTKSIDIDTAILAKKYSSTDFDNGDVTNKGFPHFDLNEEYGDTYRVIEYHHMETEKKKVKVAIADGTVLPNGTDEEIQEFAIINGVDMSYGVIENEYDVNTYYVTTICPELSPNLILEDRPGLIQIGRLPFFPWSSARINGKDSGIPELLKSIQQTYNKRESWLDSAIATSANGAMLMDPDIVDGDEERMARIVKNWNNPSYKDWTAPGALQSGREFVKELPRTQMDYGVVNEINRMLDMSDRIAFQPASSDGRVESSDESGILFARKQLQAEVTQAVLFKGLEHFWNEKGEAYLLAAKQLYGGVYRQFVTPSSGDKVEINKPVVTQEGEQIVNDISNLSRMKVVITQSPEGSSQKAVDRSINVEILRVIGPESPLTRSQATANIMATMSKSVVEKQKFQESSNLELELNKSRVMTELLQNQVMQFQLSQQLQQAQQPQIPTGEQPAESGNPIPEGQQQPAPGNPQAEVASSNQQLAQS